MRSSVLQKLRFRLAGWHILRTGLLVAGIVAGLVLLAGWLDATVGLDDQTRAAAPWFCGVGGALVLAMSTPLALALCSGSESGAGAASATSASRACSNAQNPRWAIASSMPCNFPRAPRKARSKSACELKRSNWAVAPPPA